MNSIQLLSGGAAQALVGKLEPSFQALSGCSIAGTFNAVGAMRDQLLAGDACDVIILTQTLIDQLTASGDLVAGSAKVVGVVKTGIAVKSGEPLPTVNSAESLKVVLQSAKGIYFPDPVKATAGIHFFNVLKQLGLEQQMAPAMHTYPNGATAMRELGLAQGAGLIGCTQVTEILYTPGVQLVDVLPKEFELATVYTAAVSSKAMNPQAAQELIKLLSGEQSRQLRNTLGFE